MDDAKKQFISSDESVSPPSITKTDELKASQDLGGRRFNMDGVLEKINKVKTSTKTLLNHILLKGIFSKPLSFNRIIHNNRIFHFDSGIFRA